MRPIQPVGDLPPSALRSVSPQLQRDLTEKMHPGNFDRCPCTFFDTAAQVWQQVQRCSLFFLRGHMSQGRRQTFVLSLLFFLFGDLISAEIKTPTWPAATGERNLGKYAVSWLLTYTTAVTAFTSFTCSGLCFYLFSHNLTFECEWKTVYPCPHLLNF